MRENFIIKDIKEEASREQRKEGVWNRNLTEK